MELKPEKEIKKEDVVFHGEVFCQSTLNNGAPCPNKAYFQVGDKMCCGIHSRKKKRVMLHVNPQKTQNAARELAQHKKGVEDAAAMRKSRGEKGAVTCFKMRMMKPVEFRPGVLNVFPNFRHGARTDGMGLATLSPMSIGPIDHGQFGLPPAKNLENFHQGNKVFPDEVDEHGNPVSQFYVEQWDMYCDPVPHRHKPAAHGKNAPLYSIWVTKDGAKKRMTYIQSRQFYCNFYERHVLALPEFRKLRQMIDDGYSVQICGYDAYEVAGPEALEGHYLDASRPFGHEIVLCSLLMLRPEQYPWRKYKTEDF